jgi:hypothetical protein
MSTSITETVLTLVIGVVGTISGWVAFCYQYFSEKPKIKGKLLNVMRGRMKNPENLSENLTVFTLFVYLTNARKNAVHVRDYILEVDNGNGFKKMKIIHGNLSGFRFDCADGEIQIPNFEQGVIYRQSKPIEYGVPYYGYLIFGGDLKYYDSEIKRYRVTCVDVFDNKHTITTKPDKFRDLFYLQEVFKIKFPNLEPNSGLYRPSNLISGNDVTTK